MSFYNQIIDDITKPIHDKIVESNKKNTRINNCVYAKDEYCSYYKRPAVRLDCYSCQKYCMRKWR